MRRLLATSVAVLIFALVSSGTALADDPVNLDCGDGSPLTTNVDVATLLQVQESIEAQALNPSGVVCSLNAGLTAPKLMGREANQGFVFGAGQYGAEGCFFNFTVKAHSDDGRVGGIQTARAMTDDPLCGGLGFVKAKVTCLAIVGNSAELRGQVIEATGGFAYLQTSPPTELYTDVQDNGPRSSPIRDRITQGYTNPGETFPCVAPTFEYFTVDKGNVTVRRGQGD